MKISMVNPVTPATSRTTVKQYLTALLSLALWMVASFSLAASTKVTDHYFEYNNFKYFRGKAENIRIGAYGEKKDPIGANAYLAIQSIVKAEHLASRVRYITSTGVDWDSASKSDVEVNGQIKVFGIGVKTAVSTPFSKGSSGKLKLVKFAINEGPLTTMLNQDADGARKYLADEGNDARIVSEVWVVMEGELVEHFESSPSVTVGVSALGNAVEVTAKGGKHGTQTITLSEGTVFAYLMHKVKDWKDKNKTQIDNMEDDRKGLS